MLAGIQFIDHYLGGITRGNNYLLYGPRGSGQLALTLQFLLGGLQAGEHGLLLCGDDVETFLHEARKLGLPLDTHLNEERLYLLSYQSMVREKVTRFGDHRRIVREIRHLCGGRNFDRAAICPVDPLINFSDPNNLMRTTGNLLLAVRELGPATLFVSAADGGAENSIFIQEMIDASAAAFRLRLLDNGGRELMIEKTPPDRQDTPHCFNYLVQRGVGLVAHEVADHRNPPLPPTKRRVLAVVSEPEERTRLNALLEGSYDLRVVTDESALATRLVGRDVDLVLLVLDLESARRTCALLRQNDLDLPVLALIQPTQRVTEKTQMLHLGADEVMPQPVRGVELIARIESLLRRSVLSSPYQSAKELIELLENAQERLSGMERTDPHTGLVRAEYFVMALQAEIEKARTANYPFTLASVRLPAESEELITRLAAKVRKHDLLCRFHRTGLIVLLSESDREDAMAFRKRILNGRAETEPDPFTFATFPADGCDARGLAEAVLKDFMNLPSDFFRVLGTD